MDKNPYSRHIIFAILSALFPLDGSTSANIDHAIFSAYAVRRDTGEVLICENAHLSMIPASCMKLVTTAAALAILGPEKRFETHLEYDGVIDETRTLKGNVYIRGGGDPCLGSERILSAHHWEKQLDLWVNAIQNLGILKISGKILADTGQWEKALAVPSWAWEDLGNYYGAGAAALSFHENFYSIFFQPGEQLGAPTRILYTDPPTSLTFHNELTTGPEGSGDRAWIFGSEFSPIRHIRGSIPLGENPFSIKGAIADPSALCVDLFTQVLEKRGIVIDKSAIPSQGKKVCFHTTYSPTIKEIVHWTNQKSVNLYAEHLLKKIGEETSGEGSTKAGTAAITNLWKSKNMDLSGFNMADGCGLSRKNLLSTKFLVDILLAAEKSSWFPIFLESLPAKGGAIKAKSGSMSLIEGHAGYTDKIAFSILMNQCTNPRQMRETMRRFFAKINEMDRTLSQNVESKER